MATAHLVAQQSLRLDPFRLITENKHLPENYFQTNGFENIPQFIATGNFTKDSLVFWEKFGQWWSKYPAEVKKVESVISLDEWQQVISEAAKNWRADTYAPIDPAVGPPALTASPVEPDQPRRNLSIIAPHMPAANDHDYARKKDLWIQNYPEEYKKVNESN